MIFVAVKVGCWVHKMFLTTGKYRFRYYPTPQLPHVWDAGVLFEETRALCSAPICFTKAMMSSRSQAQASSSDAEQL